MRRFEDGAVSRNWLKPCHARIDPEVRARFRVIAGQKVCPACDLPHSLIVERWRGWRHAEGSARVVAATHLQASPGGSSVSPWSLAAQ